MTTSLQNSMATIEQFISAVGQVKTAEEKTADGSKPKSEPGSIGGETSHPVKTVDDRLQDPKEGERFKENTKDVNEDQGKPSVQNAADAKAGADRASSVFDLASRFALGNGRQKRAEGGAVMRGGSAEDDQNQTGTKKTPTGEDPSVETESAKAGKEDKREGGVGGTSHPASTENDKIDGHKWASDPLEKLASDMKSIGDNLCAQISWISNQQGAPETAVKAAAHAGSQAPAPAQGQAQIDPYLAQQVGWEMAGLVGGSFDKRAADSMVVGTLEQIVKTAADDADRFVHFMDNYLAGRQKQGEGPPMPPPGGPPDPSGGGGAPPPGGPPPGGPPPGGPGGDEASMMAALGGGADAGGGAPPGGPPGAGGGMDPEVMQLAKVLEQMGVSPEELEQAMQEQAGGGGGGPPPDGGGAPPGGGGGPPGGGGGPPPGMEAQAADRAGQDKTAGMRQYISEIVQRSRARR